jgi:DHA3 family macrolide efflux protein-like MFS transporter
LREPAPSFRRFLVLWASQTLSLFGTFISQFAVNVWLVRDLFPLPSQKPELALALSATGVAMTAPLIFAMPLAGAFADRHDRRGILVRANLALALLCGLLVALLLLHALTLPLAVLLLACNAFVGSFHGAAFDSGYGLLVPPEKLPRANALMMTSYGLSQLLSPPLAATLVGLPALLGGASRLPPWMSSGVPFAFAADGVSFLVAGTVAMFMRFPRVERPAETGKPSLWGDVRAGFRWMLRRRPFLWLTANGALVNLAFAPLMLLLPLLVRDRLAADRALHGLSFEAALALVNTVGGLGGVIGGVLVSIFGFRGLRKVPLMIALLIAMGIGQVWVGFSTTLVLVAAGMFFTELMIAPLNTASFTLWQSLTPPHMLARAMSVRRFLAQSAFPLGTVIAGWMAAVVEPWIVVACAGALLVLVCLAQFQMKGFASLEERMRLEAARPD